MLGAIQPEREMPPRIIISSYGPSCDYLGCPNRRKEAQCFMPNYKRCLKYPVKRREEDD